MSTYLELTNLLLRRTLDTELTQSNFASATSTQATAKDCIKAAVQEIYSEETEWPFRYRSGSQLLTAGNTEYSLPVTSNNETSAVDWDSFRIEKDNTLGVNTTPLKLISHDEWTQFYRDKDEDAGNDGLGVPKFIFLTQGSTANDYLSFGVTPSPNEAYTVIFDYNAIYPEFTNYDDNVGIPSRFDYVIINYALKHFNMFKDNTEQAAFWTSEARKSLAVMQSILMPRKDSMRSTVINFGGDLRRGAFFGR